MLSIRDELRQSGHKCSIIATSRSSSIIEDSDVYHPRSKIALIRLLRRLKFDVLHLHIGGDVTPRVLALALTCSIFGRKKSVLTLHSGGFAVSDKADEARTVSITGLVFRRFSRIIAVNEKLADVFQRFSVPKERVTVISPHTLQTPDDNVAVPEELASFCARNAS